jgi:hypothetical protein
MKSLKSFSYSLLALTVAVPVLISAPVFARNGADDSTETTHTTATPAPDDSSSTSSELSQTNGSGSSNSGSGKRTTDQTRMRSTEKHSETVGNETEHSTEVENENEVHIRGKNMIAELQKEKHTNRSAEEIQKVCEKRKGNLEKRIAHMNTVSQAVQTRIDAIFVKAKAYQEANNLSSVSFTSLVEGATSAQTASVDSLATFKSVQPTIDCTKATTVTDLATYKAASQTVRDNLQNYKAAVRSLLVALQTAKTSEGATE